jgi:hypothetical protein
MNQWPGSIRRMFRVAETQEPTHPSAAPTRASTAAPVTPGPDSANPLA